MTEQRPADPVTRRKERARAIVSAAGVALLVVWAGWWVESVRRDTLVGAGATWIPPLPMLAGDFAVNLDHVARVRASGVNPYLLTNDLACGLSPYPPQVFRLFAWVTLFDRPLALRVWLLALSVVIGTGAVAAWRTRMALGLGAMPLALTIAAVAFSTPAVLAMERGQCDPLVVPALIGAAWLLNRRRSTGLAEIAAGGVLGVTAWLKYYPGLAVVGLVTFGRWRALGAMVLVAATIGLVDRVDVRQAIHNGAVFARVNGPVGAFCCPTKHAVSENWAPLWAATPLRELGKVPGPVAAALLLLPAVSAVSRRITRASDPRPLILPYFLWLTAAATYGMPYAIDYNLVPLMLAAVSVWDRRDPLAVQAAMAALLLWWQPLALPIDGRILFVIKLAGLYAVAASLTLRARQRERTSLGLRPHVTAVRSGQTISAGSNPSTPAQSRS